MTPREAESIKGSIDMLKRLAYTTHGVLDYKDYNNLQKTTRIVDKLASGCRICNVDNAIQIINSRDWLTEGAKMVIVEIIKEACEE